MIVCRSLSKRFPEKLALDGLNFDVVPGAVQGLLGLNGAGKTTAMQIIAGLTAPSAGFVQVDGSPPGAPELAGRIALMSDPAIARMPGATPLDYLLMISDFEEVPRNVALARIGELASTLKIESALSQPWGDLSSGNRRKIELTRVLMTPYDYLLLDEPTRELDIPSKRVVWGLVGESSAKGTTILVSSHDPLEIERLCERIVVLRDGRTVFSGGLDELPAGHDLDAQLGAMLVGE